MKNLILLVLLLPVFCNAKFYSGTVTMSDNSLKNGFIEIPEFPDDTKLKYRVEEKGKTEKLDINSVKGFEITNDKNETIKFITIFTAYQGSNKLNIDKKKSWASIVKEGKINLYRTYTTGTTGTMGVPGSGSSGGFTYYINRPNDEYIIYIDESDGGGLTICGNCDEYIIYIDESDGGGLTICGNCFSQLKKTLSKIFEDDCPKLADLIDKQDLKKNGYVRIVELYEQNCGK